VSRIWWLFVALLSLSPLAPALAQTRGRSGSAAQKTSASHHGGKLQRTVQHRFEVVYGAETISIYVYDASGQPVSARGIRGKLNLLVVRPTTGALRRGVNHQSTGATLSYQAANPKRGRLRDCLVAKHSVGEVEAQGVRVDVELSRVVDEPDGEVSFRVEFVARSQGGEWACAAEGCTKIVFVDPGECPECGERLRSREQAQRQREGAQTGSDAPEQDAAEAEGDARPRGRRPWRRR
jgi:hypothetical protein